MQYVAFSQIQVRCKHTACGACCVTMRELPGLHVCHPARAAIFADCSGHGVLDGQSCKCTSPLPQSSTGESGFVGDQCSQGASKKPAYPNRHHECCVHPASAPTSAAVHKRFQNAANCCDPTRPSCIHVMRLCTHTLRGPVYTPPTSLGSTQGTGWMLRSGQLHHAQRAGRPGDMQPGSHMQLRGSRSASVLCNRHR